MTMVRATPWLDVARPSRPMNDNLLIIAWPATQRENSVRRTQGV